MVQWNQNCGVLEKRSLNRKLDVKYLLFFHTKNINKIKTDKYISIIHVLLLHCIVYILKVCEILGYELIRLML